MLKIERDKFYVDGRGEKIRVVCIDASPEFPIIGVDSAGDTLAYTAEGRLYSDQSSGYDLVREVKEKKVLYLNLYPNHTTFGIYASKQQADDCATNFRTARIRVEYEEGQFDD